MPCSATFNSSGLLTPPTQWQTLGGLLVVVTVCDVRAWCGGATGRDGVPDDDPLRSDEDILDEQAKHALPLGNGGGGDVVVQAGEEAFEVLGELEVCLAVDKLGGHGLKLAA